MPPNIAEPTVETGDNVEDANKRGNTTEETIELQPPSTPTPFIGGTNHFSEKENTYVPKILTTMNAIVHILIGVIVVIVYVFVFKDGTSIGATPMHIVLCVTGYQLLMAEAILSLSPRNWWSLKLNLKQKRRTHWILQLSGSALAITGTFIKILDKTEHFNTIHGIFGLIALVFTTVCLVNGCASLYAQELRGILPGNVTKTLHVCFGTITFCAACITLCFGLDKPFFRGWSDPLANVGISFTAIMLLLLIITPIATFKKKVNGLLRR